MVANSQKPKLSKKSVKEHFRIPVIIAGILTITIGALAYLYGTNKIGPMAKYSGTAYAEEEISLYDLEPYHLVYHVDGQTYRVNGTFDELFNGKGKAVYYDPNNPADHVFENANAFNAQELYYSSSIKSVCAVAGFWTILLGISTIIGEITLELRLYIREKVKKGVDDINKKISGEI